MGLLKVLVVKLKYFPILDELAFFLKKRSDKYIERRIRKIASLHPSVSIGKFCSFTENVIIDEGTYCGSFCQIIAGKNSKISIGKFCAIGNSVHIKAETHDLAMPTSTRETPKKDKHSPIIIEDNVWIGDNVFIREGVVIGKNSVIGANSVVTHNIDSFSVYAGVPAKKIKNLPIIDK